MPHRPRPTTLLGRAGALLALGALVPACAAGAASAPTTDTATPRTEVDAAGPRSSAPQRARDAPYEITLVADFEALEPDLEDAVVEIRHVVVGDRRQVTMSAAGEVLDQHVVTADEHWWWLHPDIRRSVVDIEWIHIDVAEVEAVGGTLPDIVAEARRPLPAPDEVDVGDLVAGREVRTVSHVDEHEVRFTVPGVPVEMVLRRRALPAGTTIEIPAGARDLRELPEALAAA